MTTPQTKTMGPAELARQAAERKAAQTQDVEKTEPEQKQEVATASKEVEYELYQFPSAPTTMKFPWHDERTEVPDGIYKVAKDNDEENLKQIAHLEKMVRARIIGRFFEGAALSRQQKAPAPVQTLLEDNK